MIKYLIPLLVVLSAWAADDESSLNQAINAIIYESRMGYTHECGCPYDLNKNGQRCGQDSVYYHPEKYDIICYKDQITSDMLRQRIMSNSP